MTHDKRQFPWKDVVHSCGNHHSAQCPGGSFLTALLPASLAPLPQGQTQGGQGAALWQHYCQPLLPLCPRAKHREGRGQLCDSTTASLSAPGPNTGRAGGSFVTALLPASLAPLPQGQTQGGQEAALWQHYCQPLLPLCPRGQTQGGQGAALWQHYCQPLLPLCPRGQTQGGQGAALWQHYCQPLCPRAKHREGRGQLCDSTTARLSRPSAPGAKHREGRGQLSDSTTARLSCPSAPGPNTGKRWGGGGATFWQHYCLPPSPLSLFQTLAGSLAVTRGQLYYCTIASLFNLKTKKRIRMQLIMKSLFLLR